MISAAADSNHEASLRAEIKDIYWEMGFIYYERGHLYGIGDKESNPEYQEAFNKGQEVARENDELENDLYGYWGGSQRGKL